MPVGTSTRLLTLVDREFRQLVEKPAPIVPIRKFKPVKINAARFDRSWDRKRGAAARLMAVVLREDDAALLQAPRVQPRYARATAWLQRESAYLRKMAKLSTQLEDASMPCWSRCQSRRVRVVESRSRGLGRSWKP